MPGLIIYLLKVNAALCLFYLSYRFALRPLTFYYLNRFFLLFGIVFSTVYPLVDVSALFASHADIQQQLNTIVPNWHAVLPAVQHQVATVNYWGVPIMLFWLGVILMAFRLAVQFISLYRIHQRSVQADYHGEPFRAVKSDVNPFSFWQDIYLNPDKHTDAELRSIIQHEQVHVRQWHTLDVILAELSVVFYWFNPGVWFMKQAVKENLEFITDREILRSGVDEKAYQYSLVRVSALKPGAAIVNNFNFLTIKKRIMMMNKKRSSKVQITKYVVLLPLVMLLALVFTVSKAELSKKDISVIAKKILPVRIVNALAPVSSKAIVEAPVKIQDDTIKSPKVVKDSVVKTYIVVDGKDTADNGADTKVKTKTFRLTFDNKDGKDPVVIVDDKDHPANVSLSEIRPDRVKTIMVLKSDTLIDGKKRNVIVRLKPIAKVSTDVSTSTSNSLTIGSTGDAAPKAYTLDVRSDDDEIVYVIDPRELNKSEIENMRKNFKKDGFDLKVDEDFDGDKLKTIAVSINSLNKHSSASATYSGDDLRKNGNIIRIEADKTTGGVSVMSHKR
jgi:beta-lactamase regulating signal transducer with metallopeptidase domain